MPQCPVCRADRSAHEMTHRGMELYVCGACASWFVHPMPNDAERAAMYADPYAGATTGYYAKVDKKLRRSRKRARMLDAHVTTGKRFLEVGSSGGFMVEAMRERGYDCTGIEPDGPGVEFARAHFPDNTFIHGLLEQVDGPLEPFDAVYCSEVIEHVPEPRPFVAKIASLMRPGAVINVTTPDVAHFRRPKDITQWADFNPPVHCIYFTTPGLVQMFAEHGLQVFRQRFNWKPGIQVYARKVA